MTANLLEKRIAILVTDGFEQAELEGPLAALGAASAEAKIISPRPAQVQGMRHMEKGDKFKVDKLLEEAEADDYDALLLPGGLYNPDELRSTPAAVAFVRAFGEKDKPIAAICHGPQLLIEADLLKGKKLTSWAAIQTDIRNAGGEWVDEEVVIDEKLVTSRQPDDIPAFCREMVDVFAGGLTADV